MPEAKRPDPKRRSPASRPGKPGKAGDAKRDRPRSGSSARRGAPARPADEAEHRAREEQGKPGAREEQGKPGAREEQGKPGAREEQVKPGAREEQTRPKSRELVRQSIAESAEEQSEQRFGSAARRAAILAAVVCVLTLTIAGPVRTYFAQRTEMRQLKATEQQLRAQIADLEQQKVKLADPVFIAAQARERLGFVMPGDVPYQVQLPPGAVARETPGGPAAAVPPDQPWYTSLWQTIADEPHGVSPAPAPPPPGPPPPPPPPGPAPPGG